MKKRFAALFSTIIIIFSMVNSSYAVESWETWSTKATTNPYKDWTVEFSESLLVDTVNSGNIFMTDSAGNSIPAEISTSENKINIKPENAYVPDETYYLYISKDIHSSSGEALQSGIKMPFVYEESATPELTAEVISLSDDYVLYPALGIFSGTISSSDVNRDLDALEMVVKGSIGGDIKIAVNPYGKFAIAGADMLSLTGLTYSIMAGDVELKSGILYEK